MEILTKKRYVKILKFLLCVSVSWPSWPGLNNKRPIYQRGLRVLLVVQGLVVFFGQIHYLFANRGLGFDVIGQLWLGVFSSSVYWVRLVATYTQKYDKLLIYFLSEFHLEHWLHKDMYYTKINEKLERFSNYYTNFMMFSLCSATLFLNAAPIFKNIRTGVYSFSPNSTLDRSIFFDPPFINLLSYPIPTSLYDLYLSIAGFVLISGTDILMVLMVFQLIGHILITSNKIKTIRVPLMIEEDENIRVLLKRKNKLVVEQNDSKVVKEQLKDIIEHHKKIVTFADMLTDLFGPLIGHVYLFDLVGGCVLLLELSSSDLSFVFRFGPISFMLFAQLIQISIIFELIGYMSEKLIDHVYCMPWEDMSISDQKMVRILLLRVQNPIRVNAIGMVPVGLQTMASLLKASVSYYLFLNSKKFSTKP